MFAPLEAIRRNYPKERLTILALLNNNLLNSSPESKLSLFSERNQIVLEIEESIFKKTMEIEGVPNDPDWSDPKFILTYSNESFRIINWIEKADYHRIVELANNLAHVSSRDLSPELYTSHENDIALRSGQKIKNKTSKQYKCRKCGKSETTIQEVQMRSFDEGSTISAVCENCGHNWFINS